MKKILLLALTMLMAVQLFAQNILATGVVKDDKGNIITGATVTEKGTTNSTLTSIDGSFQLQLVSGNEVVLTMSGYEKQTVEVGPDGKIPDIVLQKRVKRVQFGLKAGVDCNFFEYEYEGIYNEAVGIVSDPSLGYNGGVYMDLNFGRTFSFELGLQIYKRTLEPDETFTELDFVSLNIPYAVCKWRIGKRKQFFITWGPGIEVMLKKEDIFEPVALSLNFGVGYEFACGLGFRLTSKPWLDIPINSGNCESFGASAGCALSYRFGKR